PAFSKLWTPCIEKAVWSSRTKSCILIPRHNPILTWPRNKSPRRPVSALKTWVLNPLPSKNSLRTRKRMWKESYEQEKQLCPRLLAVCSGFVLAGFTELDARPRGKEYA